MQCPLTIGVTLYNSQKYLNSLYACFDSFLESSEFNLLFVDDASIDSSLESAKNLFGDSAKYISNIENLGVSKSRNLIFQNANSSYVTFLDADDTINLRALIDLIRSPLLASVNSHPDIVLCPYHVVQANNLGVTKVFGRCENKKICNSELSEMIINYLQLPNRNGDFVQCFSKIYSLDYIQNNNIFFDESLKNFEDVMFLADSLAYFPEVHTNLHSFYTHIVHYPGVSETCNKQRSLISHFGFIKAINNMKCTLYEYLKILHGFSPADHDLLNRLEAQAIAIYTSITLVQNSVKVVSPLSFCKYYREVSSVLNLRTVHNSFLAYDSVVAGGSQLLSFLVKIKCYLLVTLLCCWKFKRRYG